jgi:hypothetical protein
MADWQYCEFLMWQIYHDRLREIEENRRARRLRGAMKPRLGVLSLIQSHLNRRERRQESKFAFGSRAEKPQQSPGPGTA